ncbi:DUF5133 domain-containing protein [Streptomyces sp. NBC_00638]|uniref:DUF5133 domain-containing protein n=1 Tax=unclassified Streptomyces TaxID=2593676 RepID=UPI0022556188|nr:DUF5133 domain-containing protein [Streptomyces sp. NBC_00638]MCX5008609.1 DUF5133 domain-containing protein [Streptomyces sp. NBC_00638]
MLMPLPATLSQLVTAYETLLAEETPDGAAPPSQRLRDLAYTLCVSTGTREIADALDTARSYLAKAAVAPASSSAVAMRPGPGRRAVDASPKPPVTTAGVFHRRSGEPSATRRDVILRPGQRPTPPPVAGAGQGSGR